MRSAIRIYGVTVNHNTSHFVELMLRTLFFTDDLSSMDFRMFVLDNRSDDEYLGHLKAYLADQRIPLIQTGFDNSLAPEKHGAAFDSFVEEYGDCTHYLTWQVSCWDTEYATRLVRRCSPA